MSGNGSKRSGAQTCDLAKQFGLSRDSIYRQVTTFFNLREHRTGHLRPALERGIEHADGVTVNAAAVVPAIQAYAKINSQRAWVDRVERVDLNSLFERMSREELEAYARDGTLPQWFTAVVGTTPADCQEDRPNWQAEQSQRETE